MNYKHNRINKNQARKLLSQILNSEKPAIIFSKHALEELENDDLTTVDAVNVLKSPDSILEDGEFVSGSWRYRVCTTMIVVVIAFTETGTATIVVTAWYKK